MKIRENTVTWTKYKPSQ